VPVEVTVQLAVGVLLGALTWWLDNDLPYSPEQLARMFERRMASAVEAGLGPCA